jgi:hypothetical protein
MTARNILVSLIAALAASAGSPAVAAGSCDIPAWVADRDPKGTNVRVAPSASADVLKRLPAVSAWPDENFAPEVEISGFSNGWAAVRRVYFADYGDGAKELFRGKGWISGRLLAASLSGVSLHAAPRSDAPILARFAGEDLSPDAIEVLGIDDCQGDFAKVRVKLPNGSMMSGWTRQPCSNQATTCS